MRRGAITSEPVDVPTRASRKLRTRVLWGLGALLLGAGATNAAAYLWPPDNERGYLHLVAAGFCLYLFFECRRHVLRSDAFGLLAPPLLSSIVFAFFSFILPITASLQDSYILFRFDRYFFEPVTQISYALAIVATAIFCMWRGYGLGVKVARRFAISAKRAGYLRKEWTPRMLPLFAMQIIFILLAVTSINLGIFGIASSVEARQQNIQLLDLLNLGMAGGSLSLLLLLTVYFRRRTSRENALGLGLLCLALIVLQLIFGALSGFKSQLVMPFIMLFIAQFLATRRINPAFVVMGVAALFVAYLVIEPYRAYLGAAGLTGKAGVQTLADAMQSSRRDLADFSGSGDPLTTQIATRFDLTLMTALGLQAADAATLDDALISNMAESIYLSPILAFMPRFIWSEKGSYTTGGWFNQLVLGAADNDATSVAMGPVAYLYFMGGIFGVVAGFLAIGFIQAMIFEGVARVGAGGVIIYMSAISTLVMLPSDVGPALTGMLRILAIAFVVQMALLMPDASRKGGVPNGV
jgi:hypothetical protein